MTAALLLCSAIMGQAAGPALDEGAVLKAYQAVKAESGRTADDQVKLALWCEAHGLTAERLKHLTRAVLLDPADATARGLLGQVSYNGNWLRPDAVEAEVASDPDAQEVMREYLHRRAETAETANDQAELARWCDGHDLKAQAETHYKAALRIDPRRESIWKKLGYKKHDGRWVRSEELAAEKAEFEAQKHADKYWKPKLERDREGLVSRDPARRRRAEEALDAVDDPRAVPTIWSVFVRDDVRMQEHAARLFGQIEGASASRGLASLAVYSTFPEVRGRAQEYLARRDPHDFLDLLINLIHKPFKYEVKPIQGAGSVGGLVASGESYDLRREYRLAPFNPGLLPPRIFSGDVPFNPVVDPTMAAAMGMGMGWNGASIRPMSGTPALSPQLSAVPGLANAVGAARGGGGTTAPGLQAAYANAQRMAVQRDQQIALILARQQQIEANAAEALRQDVESIEQTNQGIRELDDRVLPLVKTVTGQDFGTDQEAWKKWWTDELGYAYTSTTPKIKPVYTSIVAVPSAQRPPHHSCFAAGTPVRTIDGLKPIESLLAGDRVLSQDPNTGALSYQPVLLIHHNPPAPLLRLTLGSESVLATGIHRFWKAGKGWTMARDLKPGDLVRTLGGTVALKSTEPAGTAPVFNLDVAANRDYFVGQEGMLVYDFSVVQPIAKPFDATASR